MEHNRNYNDHSDTEQLGGKARGLLQLAAIGGVTVPPFAAIPADASPARQSAIVAAFLRDNPHAGKVAVRSSALNEDSAEASLAGAFKTHLGVAPDMAAVLDAIADVRAHGNDKLENQFNNAASAPMMGVVVQQMVENPDFAGVCLTQGYGAEDAGYLLVNFKKGLGDGLVGGAVDGTQLRVLRDNAGASHPFLPQLLDAVRRIEDALGQAPLDMEFAFKDGVLYMLQCRPLVTAAPATVEVRAKAEAAAQAAARDIRAIPAGDVLCDMADINPRELLGHPVAPVNLALYRRMFADDVVEAARKDMGYAPLETGLLRVVAGKPYVSLRASAYSLRPEGIGEATYDKMTAIYAEKIAKTPSLQDKVEFSVYVTGAHQLPAFFAENAGVFSAEEQREITGAFVKVEGRLAQKTAHLCEKGPEILENYRKKLRAAQTPAECIEVLREGTRLFVQAARLAFYQKALCDGVYGAENTVKLLTGLDTPTERLRRDLLEYAQGTLSEDALAAEYGHLRPGQMDVFAPAYRDDLARQLGLAEALRMTPAEIAAEYAEIAEKQRDIDALRAKMGTQERHDMDNLRFLFALRENVKHEFMKAFDRIAGGLCGLPLETAAAPALLLPGILTQKTDLGCIEIRAGGGTYFGAQKVVALPLVVTDDNLHGLTREQVAGRILVMDHADPGYDFLLLMEPAGIVTKVGGPASHIAIRVNEKGIPACIGCGIDLATVDENAPYVLDCAEKKRYALPAPKREGRIRAHRPS